ncbi:hypothetical protein GCK72_005739 [Caenorhabditis remanei]|uniref:ribonuclease H n=1 Tax=Caenorhabditis remanei TaxID=31234 RepID=A0A6A5HGE5_CAERE|nr:hypothetical protein GCK72_005739 [Caenorhabditis remanei]KAF1765786.1 hypothetical protein GCK72_005739 [Caenorhabditis remanei]
MSQQQQSNFSMDLYTDGAALRNGQNDAKGGWAVVYEMNGQIFVSKHYFSWGRQTNNLYELTAIFEAIRIARRIGIRNITIKTDSMYSINAITKWYWNWRKNGWLTRARKAVKNREIIEEIRKSMSDVRYEEGTVKIEYVKAHGQNYLNNLADKNAKLAAYYPSAGG